jgi:hypothetical protein
MNDTTANTTLENKTASDVEILKEAVHALPVEYRQEILELVYKIESSRARSARIANLAQNAICELRLQTKYMQFDLEATQRERDHFAEQI